MTSCNNTNKVEALNIMCHQLTPLTTTVVLVPVRPMSWTRPFLCGCLLSLIDNALRKKGSGHVRLHMARVMQQVECRAFSLPCFASQRLQVEDVGQSDPTGLIMAHLIVNAMEITYRFKWHTPGGESTIDLVTLIRC